MNIGRLLIVGFIVLSASIVVVLISFFLSDMRNTTGTVISEFASTIGFVQDKNQSMLGRIDGMSSETGDIAAEMGKEQMRLVGQAVANDIRMKLETSFADTRTAAEYMLSYRDAQKAENERPNREISNAMLQRFIELHPEYFAAWSAWEPEAYDHDDKGHIDVDPSKSEGEQNPTGRYFPWFVRKADHSIYYEYMTAEECETEDYYLLPKNTGHEWVLEPYLDDSMDASITLPTLMTSFCIPIMENHRFLGVFGADISIDGLSKMIETYKPYETGYVMLVSPGGIIAAHSNNPDMLMKDLSDLPETEHSLELIENGLEGFYGNKAFGHGQEVLKYHVPLQIGNSPDKWTVIVLADFDQVMKARNDMMAATDNTLADVRTISNDLSAESKKRTEQMETGMKQLANVMLQKTLILGGVVLFIASVIGVIFSRQVNRSIMARDHWYRQILDTADSPCIVLDNDLKMSFLNRKSIELLNMPIEKAIDKPVNDIWNDEIHKTAHEVAVTTGRTTARKSMTTFKRAIWEIHADALLDQKGKRIGFVEFLQDISDRESIYRLVGEIKRIVEVTQNGTTEITTEAEHLSSGSEKQTESLNEIVSMITAMSQMASQNANRAENANQITHDVESAAMEGQKQMKHMVDSMRQISENARNTQQVVKSIDEIAFQTNLLALNAAVEAARAGTHGKGFAVVAEEVRNLAARSGKAAHETEDMIKLSNAKIDKGVEIANQTADALNRIVELVTQTTGLISEIATSSNDQTTSVHEVEAGVKVVSTVTQQNSATAHQTARSASELNKAMNELSSLVLRMSKVS